MALSPLDIARIQQYRAATERHLPIEERARLRSESAQAMASHPLAYGLSESAKGAIGAGAGSAILLAMTPMIERSGLNLIEQSYKVPFSHELGKAIALAGSSDPAKASTQFSRAAMGHLQSLSEITGHSGEQALEDLYKRVEEAGKRPQYMQGLKAVQNAKNLGVPVGTFDDAVGRAIGTIYEEHTGVPKKIISGARWAKKHKWPLLLGSMGLFGMLKGIKSLVGANREAGRPLEDQQKIIQDADIEAALSATKPNLSSMAFPLVYMATG